MVAAATVNLSEISAQWRVSRKLYVVYSALVRSFELGELCPELETPINRAEPEILERIQQWFDSVDQKVEAHHVRQLLQGTNLSTEENLRFLLKRYLSSAHKTAAARDKTDYLLVQYFAHCAPTDSHNRTMPLEEVADVLHPILGDVDLQEAPHQLEIQAALRQIDECHSLADLLNGSILEKVRAMKSSAADFFAPAVLVSFTRLNYLIRLAFFRLMHADLHAVRHALHQIEARGQIVVDCSRAGMSSQESLSSLRQICHEWKKPFRAAYSAGNNFRQLVEVRAALEHALTQPFTAPAPLAAPLAQAAAATASPTVSNTVAAVAPTPEPKETPAKPAVAQTVDSCLEQLAMQLISAKESVSATNVNFGNVKLMLASWELAAFLKGGDEVSDVLQRAVAARALLSIAMAAKAAGEPSDLDSAVRAAHGEIALLQSRVEDAKQAKDIDGAVNLAASGKRLQALIAEAGKK